MQSFRKIASPNCWLLIGMLLFAQAAFAARPCVQAGMSAASALAANEDHGCCETSVTEVNLCVMKCTDSDKVSAHTPLLVPPPASEPFLTVAMQDSGRAAWNGSSRGNSSHDPPKTIRFCSFLI